MLFPITERVRSGGGDGGGDDDDARNNNNERGGSKRGEGLSWQVSVAEQSACVAFGRSEI
jgi:hypothetical protein